MSITLDTEIQSPSYFSLESVNILPKIQSALHTFQELGKLTLTQENIPFVGMITSLTTLSIANTFFSPFILGKLIESVNSPKKSALIGGFALSKTALVATLVASSSLGPTIRVARDYLSQKVQANILKKALEKSVQYCLERPLEFHIQTSISDMFGLIYKAFSLQEMSTLVLVDLVQSVMEATLFAALFTYKFGPIMGATIATASVIQLAYGAYSTKQSISLREESIQTWDETFQKMGNLISQYKLMRDLNQEEKAGKELNEAVTKLHSLSYKTSFRSALNQLCTMVPSYFPLFGTAYLFATTEDKNQAQALLPIFGCLGKFSSNLIQLASNTTRFLTLYPDLEHIFSKLSLPSEIQDPNPEVPLVLKSAPEIAFENVQFCYPTKEENLFVSLSFSVEPGSKTALVSRSGAGKSTIFQLLYGYYQQEEGSIWIDGQNTQDVSLKSIQEQVTILGQQAILFEGTIRENILYGAKREVSDQELYSLAEELGFEDFFDSFEKGLGTDVGEWGKALSGGQQQKVALLRSLLKKAPIRLLDEATASLDNLSAGKMLDYLLSPDQDVTTLMITHKLSEAKRADQILFLEEGKITHKGTHEELLETCRSYKELWDAQNTTTEILV